MQMNSKIQSRFLEPFFFVCTTSMRFRKSSKFFKASLIDSADISSHACLHGASSRWVGLLRSDETHLPPLCEELLSGLDCLDLFKLEEFSRTSFSYMHLCIILSSSAIFFELTPHDYIHVRVRVVKIMNCINQCLRFNVVTLWAYPFILQKFW